MRKPNKSGLINRPISIPPKLLKRLQKCANEFTNGKISPLVRQFCDAYMEIAPKE